MVQTQQKPIAVVVFLTSAFANHVSFSFTDVRVARVSYRVF